MKTRMMLGLLALGLAGAAGAEVQRCKDEAGKTYYSDRGCAGGEKMRGAPDAGAHTIATAAGDEDVARRCLSHALGGQVAEPETGPRVHGYRVQTVAVRNVGPRRLFTVTAAWRTPAGYWMAGDTYKCLLRGDNVTFQTTPYEIVN